jgi:23S rRNA (uracil1939-C5)-methyltransferase
VRLALPGEEITIFPEEEKKNYLVGKLLSIEHRSDARVTAPCPYFGECGGCDLQHAGYAEQLHLKTEIVRDLLSRQIPEQFRHTALEAVRPALPAPRVLNYRQRIRLQVDKAGRCGFRKFHSHDIVPIKACLIAGEELNEVLARLFTQPAFNRLLANTTEIELLWNPASAKVTALFHLIRKPRPADRGCAGELCETISLLERVFFRGPDFSQVAAAPANCGNSMAITYPNMRTPQATLTLRWEVGGFCQVNLDQNRNLVDLAVDLADVHETETVLDLFCGMGNFSIPLAARAKSLLGIEGQGAAIRSARANSDAAGLNNTAFRKSPIHDACDELAASGESFDCLLVDPPRQGIPGLAEILHTLCRRRMVYISCDPATLCRDLSDLCPAGFTIKAIQPVDMFPQTHHIETVVLLEKN